MLNRSTERIFILAKEGQQLGRFPFDWNFVNSGENSNGTVHPGGKFSEKW